jgi:hypothetical protein
MKSRAIGAFCAAALVLALGAPARAVDLRVGANANFGTADDFGVGPRVELDIGDYVPGLRFAVDYHRFFSANVYNDVDGLSVDSSAWDAGLHVLYDLATLPVAEGATIYAGGGVLYAKRSYDHALRAGEEISDAEFASRHAKLEKLQEKYVSDKGVGFALSVGSTFATGWTVVPFVEARYTIGVVDELVLAAGILFATGLAGP